MADKSYGTVTKAGAASMSYGGMTRRGPGKHKVVSGGRPAANPRGTIRSTGQQVKGPDKGTGGGM